MAESKAWVMIPILEEDGKTFVLDFRPLVLCEDCKFYEPDGIYTMCYRHNGLSPDADWFCADGERKEVK